MAYSRPGMVSRINSSSRWTMGCRSGIALRTHFSISAWLSDGVGGVRAVLGLRVFAMDSPPSTPMRAVSAIVAQDLGVQQTPCLASLTADRWTIPADAL